MHCDGVICVQYLHSRLPVIYGVITNDGTNGFVADKAGFMYRVLRNNETLKLSTSRFGHTFSAFGVHVMMAVVEEWALSQPLSILTR